ncbi:unnamed protein product [Victoria cruziana]
MSATPSCGDNPNGPPGALPDSNHSTSPSFLRARDADYFRRFLSSKRQSVHEELNRAVYLREPKIIHEAMRYALLTGGKYIASILCIVACELVGGTQEAAMASACALEMIHAASVVQYDFPSMDDGEVRRGKPAIHKVFGEAMTILAADALIAFAFEHVASASTDVPPETVVRLIAELAKAGGSEGLVAGQVVELATRSKQSDISLDQLEFINSRKPGALLQASVTMGAILGGGSDEEIGKLQKYARCIGLLYQIVDDMLDATNSSERLGKMAGRDPADGKIRFPDVMGMQRCRQFVEELNQEAKQQLLGLPMDKVRPLLYFSDYIAFRQL